MNIYYDDLYPDAKQAVLKFLKIKDPTELNLDVIPLFNLERADIDDRYVGIEDYLDSEQAELDKVEMLLPVFKKFINKGAK